MVFLPPRSSKSVLCSKLFPAWYIGRHPEHEILTVSHSDQLSSDFGRSVRDVVSTEEFQKIFRGVQLLRAERAGNLNRGIGDMAAAQRAQGFDFAVDRARTGQEMTNKYGMDVLAAQTEAGGVQRGIASEGIAADYEEYIKEQDYDYKQLQFLHSLLQGMPLSAQSRSYTEPSQIDELVNAGYDLETILKLVGLDGGSGSESETELNYDINNDGVEDEYDVGPAQPV